MWTQLLWFRVPRSCEGPRNQRGEPMPPPVTTCRARLNQSDRVHGSRALDSQGNAMASRCIGCKMSLLPGRQIMSNGRGCCNF